MRLQGLLARCAHDLFGQQKITSIVFDVEHINMIRRRSYRLAIVPIVRSDERDARMHPGFGLALQVAVDLLRTPPLHRGVVRRIGRFAMNGSAPAARRAPQPECLPGGGDL